MERKIKTIEDLTDLLLDSSWTDDRSGERLLIVPKDTPTWVIEAMGGKFWGARIVRDQDIPKVN